jgi:Zn-dependent peptidase ImmA (M78 family)
MRAFDYDLTWDGEPRDGAEHATWGRLLVRLGEQLLWAERADEQARGVRWTWVDLLEHLAEIWPWLLFEEGWPGEARIRDPKRFLADSRSWLDALAPHEAAEAEDVLFEFRHRHDLSMGVPGVLLPQLWIVRMGKRTWVGSTSTMASLPCEQVEQTLTALGEEIAARLAAVSDDERASSAIAAWSSRMDLRAAEVAAISAGLSEERLMELAGGDLETTFEIATDVSAANFAPNELLAAARMASPATDPSIVQTIIAAMRGIRKLSTAVVDQLSEHARAELQEHAQDQKPAVLGYSLARWLRRELRLDADGRFDPKDLLYRWGVHVGELDVDDDAIEAVACWGAAHGPAILINRRGRHSQKASGRRATLAHEICHLLVDREAALPLAEVFGGAVSRPVEQRANAFAAEMLIARETAGTAFHQADDPEDTLDHLCTKFGVSREIVAWQAYNSGIPMRWSTFVVLRMQVSHRERFDWRVASGRLGSA